MCSLLCVCVCVCRNKNKFLPKIQEWVKAHGGGLVIPFSIEFEEQVWGLKEDPAAQAECKFTGEMHSFWRLLDLL